MTKDETDVQELTAALEREKKAHQQAEAELARVEKRQQEFISLVSHELRIPMTAIQGYTDLLIKAVMGPVNETQLSFLHTIRSNVERMARMVADLSDINKITSGNLKIKLRAVVLKPVIHNLVADFQVQLSLKKLTLNATIPESMPPLWCDADRLRQVLVNLLRNAIQYTQDGGNIDITATPDPDEPGYIQVQVRDSGIGIPTDQQNRVFEIFFRASDDETRQTSGNGLALHLAKLLVEMQAGTICFISTQGQGTTFTISLPVARPQLKERYTDA